MLKICVSNTHIILNGVPLEPDEVRQLMLELQAGIEVIERPCTCGSGVYWAECPEGNSECG